MPEQIDLVIPSLGESVAQATIAKWLKTDGQRVKADEVVAELETDKASVELPAPAAGTLHTLRPQGETVNVGDIVARIDTSATATTPAVTPAAVAPAAAPPPTPAPAPKPAPVAPPAPAPKPAPVAPPAPAPVAPSAIPAITDQGMIALKAQEGAAQSSQTSAPPSTPVIPPAPPPVTSSPITPPPITTLPPKPVVHPPALEEEREELSKLRQTLAHRLVEAQHATASLTTFNEVDLSAITALREKYKESFEKLHGIGLGFMSFFAKAVVYAQGFVPQVNYSLDGNTLIKRRAVHLGIAVSTDRGLMVPILRNAQGLSMAQIEAEIKRLATKARDGKISVDDMVGGTFTITNGGVFGSLLSTPILNPPQSAILGMHKIEKRPIVVQEAGKDVIVVRPMMYVALTYDHRVIDGRQSVTFLVKVKEALEDPARILLEV